MNSPSTKQEIIDAINQVFDDVYSELKDLSTEIVSYQSLEKWPISLQLEHLIISAQPVATALNLPKITFRAFGIPEKDSRTYEEVVSSYQAKLEAGAKATSKYIPSPKEKNKIDLLEKWLEVGDKLVDRIERLWTEDQLERYLLPHPVLGKLSVREMLFFTIYHTIHHHNSMKKLIDNYHLSINK